MYALCRAFILLDVSLLYYHAAPGWQSWPAADTDRSVTCRQLRAAELYGPRCSRPLAAGQQQRMAALHVGMGTCYPSCWRGSSCVPWSNCCHWPRPCKAG